MIEFLTGVWAFLTQYKKAVLSSLLVLALVSGAIYLNRWDNQRLNDKYTQGVSDTDAKWEIVVAKERKSQQDYKNKQQAESDKLADDLENSRLEQERLKRDLAAAREAYGKTAQGQTKGLDDTFVDLYNKSLMGGK